MEKANYISILDNILNTVGSSVTDISNRDYCFYYRNGPSEIKYATGASKFTILNEELGDKVIKIPFSYDEDCDGECTASATINENCDGDCCNCPHWKNYNDDFPDYCDAECCVYEWAEKAGLEYLFAKEEVLGHEEQYGKEVKYYLQDRVPHEAHYFGTVEYDKGVFDVLLGYALDEDESNRGIINRWGDNSFVQAVQKYYGEEVALELCKFFDDNGINDIHNGNWGYTKDEAPIVFDYSGFGEW